MSKRLVKKERILDAGLATMKSHGYNGTSVKDIVDAAGIPKGSFYNYFTSKEDFARQAIHKEAGARLDIFRVLMEESEQPPLERLHDAFARWADDLCSNRYCQGCFIGTLCQEVADSCETLRGDLAGHLNDYTALISEPLIEARDRGTLPANVDVPALAEFILNAWEGALLRMKAAKSREPLDAFLSQLPLLFR